MTSRVLPPVVALLLVLTAGPAPACPVKKLSSLIEAPLKSFRKIEIPVEEHKSTEGGVWHVYLKGDGKPHTVVRTDLGETGKWQMRASFLDAQTFALAWTEERYALPFTSRDLVVNKTTRTIYFFCEGAHFTNLLFDKPDAENATAASLLKELSAPEISAFIKRLKQ